MIIDKERWDVVNHVFRNAISTCKHCLSSMRKRSEKLEDKKCIEDMWERCIRIDNAMIGMTAGNESMAIKSPVDMKKPIVRYDLMGRGGFADRRDEGTRLHNGVDLVVEEGEDILATLKGSLFFRKFQAYAGNTHYTGVEEYNNMFISKISYVTPVKDLIKSKVEQGTVIGHAQNISARYGHKMKIHIHWSIFVNPAYVIPLDFSDRPS